MRFFLQNSKTTKIISVGLVYTFFLVELIPFSRAMNAIENFTDLSENFHLFSEQYRVVSQSDQMVSDNRVTDQSVKTINSIKKVSAPLITLASGGPGQAEIIGSTANVGGDLVDKFTGNMAYSLPLMDVEGFPIVLSYDPNVSMDQEASWVGLGWNLSLGSINREMRGIPDDFNGDKVERISKLKNNLVDGYSNGFNVFAGTGNTIFKNYTGPLSDKIDKENTFLNYGASISFSRGKYTNNYSGEGQTMNVGIGGSVSLLGVGVNPGVGFSTDDQNGIGANASFGFEAIPSFQGYSGGYQSQKSIGINSRSGVKTVSSSHGWQIGVPIMGVQFSGSATRGSMRTYGVQSFVPRFNTSNYINSKQSSAGYNGTYVNFGTKHVGGGYQREDYNSETANNVNVNYYSAFGYNNYTKGKNNPMAMLDFNRGGSTNVSSEMKQISFSTPTHDLFFCSAPGISSSYRAYRYDVQEYHDPKASSVMSNDGTNDEINITAGTNISGGLTAGVGYSHEKTDGSNISTTSGALNEMFNGISGTNSYNGQEYVLKTQGEIKPVDETLLNAYQGKQASQLDIELNTVTSKVVLNGKLKSQDASLPDLTLPAQNYNFNRSSNSIHYREKKISEMKPIPIYTEVNLESGCPNTLVDNDGNIFTDAKLGHHTGAIEAVNENGMRYIFGIPTYSYNQSEVAFSASGLYNETNYNTTGMVKYDPGDNSINNSKGRHQMFEKTITPAFATTFLLTDMLSADYVDRTGDGPSVDDQGNYYKLNYTNPYDQWDPYKWRMPMCSDLDDPQTDFEKHTRLAYLNRNYHSDEWDDMANYMYGEKDMWYAVSVESKNLIAYFYLENREDQFSVKNENGGLELTKPGRLLKKIILYSKNDLEKNLCDNAVPLQIIEFDYDYSLCKKYVGNKNTYNGDVSRSGKLTLNAIYVYSGKSKEGKGVPIEFDYDVANPLMNPDFAFNSSDRWGNYKPNDPNMPNHEFPYADQSQQAHQNIQAWKLKSVDLTSGTKTEFTYMADEYAFVQNKRAMRMFNVKAMSNVSTLNGINVSILNDTDLINISGVSNTFRKPEDIHDYYNVIYFKLEEPISASPTANQKVIEQYFNNEKGIVPDYFYFNMYSKLGNRVSDKNEFIESSVKIGKQLNNGNYIGVAGIPDGQNNYNYGWVIVQPEDLSKFGDKRVVNFLNDYLEMISQFLPFSIGPLITQKVNPLIISNWQYARLNVPCTVYGQINYTASIVEDYCDYNLSNDINIFGANIYKEFNKDNFGLFFDSGKSMIRLYEPDNAKIGGGCRVSSITVHDKWDQFSGEYNTSYTYNYDYSDGTILTSGVASYEPQVGNNENPLYQLVAYDYPMFLLPNEKAYQKDPWGDLVYSAPNVGYSVVKSSLFYGSVVGYIIDEFYTLKEFPTIARSTSVKRIKAAGYDALEENGIVTELYGFSQGFYVETSDYHGKPKGSRVYGKIGELISSSEVEYYNYNTELLKYLNPDGEIISSSTPKDFDIYADSWSHESNFLSLSKGQKASAGISVYPLIFPFPLIIPILKYGEKESLTEYYSKSKALTFNKVVHNYVVAKNIKTNYLGSNNTAQNEYFDFHTGDVIVSSLKDEFNDELTSMTYPAHWYYNNFQNMSFSDGAIIKNNEISPGFSNNIIQINSVHGISLNEGDQLEIHPSLTKAWVLEKQGINCFLIDKDGIAISGINWSVSSIKIERTGRKNILSADMMNVVTKKFQDPVGGQFTFPSNNIISSSAVTFSENKQVACIPLKVLGSLEEGNYPSEQLIPGGTINPFRKGTKGNFRLLSSFAFQKERVSTDPNKIRQDGILANYEPFYALVSGEWYSIDEIMHPDFTAVGEFNEWRQMGKTDHFDEFGKPIQVTDQIEVSSAVVYGMNNNLKLVQKATAVNAKANEIGFDGFEDYSYYETNPLVYLDYGFSLKPTNLLNLVSEFKHSGKYSLKVPSGSSIYEFDVNTPVTLEGNIEEGEYIVQECNCIQGFAPNVNKEYWFSTWVHENTIEYPFENSKVQIDILNSSGGVISGYSYEFLPVGAVIDGWQRVEGKYTIPAGAKSIQIKLISSTTASYFDDFRTHPLLAGMTTTVYNQNNLLPIAEHDGYNFTTFYNYDENFQLVRIRVETVEGIKTISESETGSFRKAQ